MERNSMIGVMLNDGTTEVFLARVDHVSDAQSAAHVLWESVYALSKVHGGGAFLVSPEERKDNAYAVMWDRGPVQWADAYVVSDGADARGFVAVAENGDTVVFRETD
jgi:hypothetical protein